MTEPPLEPLQNLREQFRLAAARQIDAERRARTRRKRIALITATSVAATGGLAAATHLISTGSPVKEPRQKPSRFPVGNVGTVAVIAQDPDAALPWGVVTYRTSHGDQCALVGHLRGSDLGSIRDGRFHPFERKSGGACGDIGDGPFFADIRTLDGRTLIFGRASANVAAMRIKRGRDSRTARTGPGGAFLFVYAGHPSAGEFHLTPIGRNGKPIH